MCKKGEGPRFAESTQTELLADGMPKERKRRRNLETRNNFPDGAGKASWK